MFCSLTPVNPTQGLSILLTVIASFHAPAERHPQMKMDSPRLMVRRAHDERTGYLQSSPSAALRVNSAKQS